jgi:CDP-2,3-bis-(O-geranylgeranyl)-sn-glycerol synthase
MINEIIFVFWFFAPSGVSNIAAFLAGKNPVLKQFATPVDFGLKYRGRRILGDNKTFRGFISGIIASILIVYLQIYLYQSLPIITLLIHLFLELYQDLGHYSGIV